NVGRPANPHHCLFFFFLFLSSDGSPISQPSPAFVNLLLLPAHFYLLPTPFGLLSGRGTCCCSVVFVHLPNLDNRPTPQ
ncbi:hypothetical protein F4775DRAFT_558424, partial [Biscogniauxia sp. FL1348]